MAKYNFKGYTISNCGYHQPDHCVWWEAVDDSGAACFHGQTLREVEFMILDSEWEAKLRDKEAEIAELRECLKIIRDNILSHTIKSEDGKYVNNGVFLSEEFVDDERWRKALEGGAK